MKRAWTEGPWTAKERLTPPSEGTAADWLILGSNGNDIAILFDGSQEDARLISAAPELYEALADLVAGYTSDKGKRAVAALKKAEG